MTAQTDRELLELAAKAAGMDVRWYANDCLQVADKCNGFAGKWNPLTDDGDALRLAVKLHMKVRIDATGSRVWDSGGGPKVHKWRIHPTEDQFADTRRAIVLAAAAIATHKEPQRV